MSVPAPVEIRLRTRSRLLEVRFDDGACFSLPAEYLRVYSPSAEVTGHGVAAGLLISGKEAVGIRAGEPVGHYGARLMVDDGHDKGPVTWKYLHEPGTEQEEVWRGCLQRLSN